MHDETPMTTPDTPAGAQAARKLLTPDELVEIRYRYEQYFEHCTFELVRKHVGWLLDHIEALEAQHAAPRAADADDRRSGGE